jgi:hypothetical protein
VLTFFIAGLLYLLRFECVDNLGAYSIPSETLAVGFASWLLVMIAGSAAVKPGEDFEEPFGMLFGSAIYVAMANVCYTLGWVVDTILYNGRPRTRLYKSGLILAVVLAALPGVWAVVGWLITVYTGRKLD